MISESFRKKFKKDLGQNYAYTPEIRKILNKAGVTNRKGEPFSAQSIRNVFLGKEENRIIEIAIMECYKTGLEYKRKLEQLRDELGEV